MTRAKKQLSKRNDIGSGELRKSICFDGLVPWQLDFHAGRNARLRDEDILEVHEDNEDSIAEDLLPISLVQP